MQVSRFSVGSCQNPPSPMLLPILTTLRTFQWLRVEHHVGHGHLGLCWGLCGAEADGSAKEKGICGSALSTAITKPTGPNSSTGHTQAAGVRSGAVHHSTCSSEMFIRGSWLDDPSQQLCCAVGLILGGDCQEASSGLPLTPQHAAAEGL